MAGPRRRARIIAFQALWEIEAAGHDAETALAHLLTEGKLSEANASFARALVRGVVRNRDKIDEHLRRFAPAWPLEQMALVDKSILRLALYEVLLDNGVPTKVAINEAVELARTFGSDSSSRFVNGVLGAVSTLADN